MYFRKSFLKIIPNRNCSIMKNYCLSNRLRNIIKNPEVNKVIATFSGTYIEIKKIRNENSAIHECQFVLGSQCMLHRVTRCKVVQTIKLWGNGERICSFTRMDVKNWISVRIWMSNLSRNHGRKWMNVLCILKLQWEKENLKNLRRQKLNELR